MFDFLYCFFVFLGTKWENNFIWALEKLQGLLFRLDVFSQFIVNDKDLVLINEIITVFLEVSNLLCWFHIKKNVKAKCNIWVDYMQAWEVAMDAWVTVMYWICDCYAGLSWCI